MSAPTGDSTFALWKLQADYDEKTRLQREKEDAFTQEALQSDSPAMRMNTMQSIAATPMNRARTDMAMGPGGFNRQWAGFPIAGLKKAMSPMAKQRRPYDPNADISTDELIGQSQAGWRRPGQQE